ncbi:GNAT family N-acetyltransferase [Streptomyces sp. NPDC046759]|uniref:GNAT family N-acetyltransferase n=1 Tax=Streptomyces sp. NPDC046759 TaxID=3155019 RepID=UPI0033ED9EAC
MNQGCHPAPPHPGTPNRQPPHQVDDVPCSGTRVRAAARGRGHARRIVDELVDWLHEASIRYIQLHASEAGKPVYEAAGFVTGRSSGMDLITTPAR